MSESTLVYRAEFFFITKFKKFSVNRSVTIGRTEGDIVIDDKVLSSKHCKLNISGITISVTDLGSTNGTFLNGRKLPANEEHQIQLGDRLRIGSYEYICTDHDEILNSEVGPEQDTFKFKPQMLFNFFEASFFQRFIYVVALAFFELFTFFVLEGTISVPPVLNFLTEIKASLQIRAMVFVFLTVYSLNLIHAYTSRVYLKKSLALRFFFFVILTFVQMSLVGFILITHELDISNYLRSRRLILKEQRHGHTVPIKKTLQDFERSYSSISSSGELSIDQQNILTKDYQYVLSKNKTQGLFERVSDGYRKTQADKKVETKKPE
jgi:hypothetical protein